MQSVRVRGNQRRVCLAWQAAERNEWMEGEGTDGRQSTRTEQHGKARQAPGSGKTRAAEV